MKDTAGGSYLAGLCYWVLGPQASPPARVEGTKLVALRKL